MTIGSRSCLWESRLKDWLILQLLKVPCSNDPSLPAYFPYLVRQSPDVDLRGGLFGKWLRQKLSITRPFEEATERSVAFFHADSASFLNRYTIVSVPISTPEDFR